MARKKKTPIVDSRWKDNAPKWALERALKAQRELTDKTALDRAFRRLETDFGRKMATEAWSTAKTVVEAEQATR